MYNLNLPVDLKKAAALEKRHYLKKVRKRVIFHKRTSSLNITDRDEKLSVGNIRLSKRLGKNESSLDLQTISFESGFNDIASESAIYGDFSAIYSRESDEKYNSVPIWLDADQKQWEYKGTPKRTWETALGIKTPDIASQNKHDLLLRTQSGVEDSRKTTGPTGQLTSRSLKIQAFENENEVFCNFTVKEYPTGVPVIMRTIQRKPSSLQVSHSAFNQNGCQSETEIKIEKSKEMGRKQKVVCFAKNDQNILPKKSKSYGYLSTGLRNAKATVCNSLSQNSRLEPICDVIGRRLPFSRSASYDPSTFSRKQPVVGEILFTVKQQPRPTNHCNAFIEPTKSKSTDRLNINAVNTQAGEVVKIKHGGLKRSTLIHEVHFAETVIVTKLDFQSHLSLLPETMYATINSITPSRTSSTSSFKTMNPYTYECILTKVKRFSNPFGFVRRGNFEGSRRYNGTRDGSERSESLRLTPATSEKVTALNVNEIIELNEVTLTNLDSLENLGGKVSNEYVPTTCIFQRGDSSLGVEYMENSFERDPSTPEGFNEFEQPGISVDKNARSQSIKELFQKDTRMFDETCSSSEEIQKSPLYLQPIQMAYLRSEAKTLRATETQVTQSGPSSSIPTPDMPSDKPRPDNIENYEEILEHCLQGKPSWATESESSSNETATDKPTPNRRMVNLFTQRGRWSNQQKSKVHASLTTSFKSRTVSDPSANPTGGNHSRSMFTWKSKTIPSGTNHTAKTTLINLTEEQHDESLQLPEGLLVLQTEKNVKMDRLIERLQRQVCTTLRPLIVSVLFSSDCGQHIVNVTYRKDACRSMELTENDFLINCQEVLCNPTPVLHVVESEVFEENRQLDKNKGNLHTTEPD
ncbi:hypothetical protein PHET_05098 [Paragonimus heterotremus]|uniref:Uncharacterized protein n=1 Tax=Paragonimus heterotremus TaxID=100268 RepID=A0A8J4WIV2_9TREM|nr:hypothetical protein PHET_05098 [Paragonimus heterotremus]